MYLEEIKIINFKNYKSENISFSEKINFIRGKNGSGKTNLLDAIYYLSFTKSAFNKLELNNLKENEDFFSIKGRYRHQNNTIEVDCRYKKNDKKKILYNQSQYEKISEHLGKIPAVLIIPNDSDLIRNSSYYRRRFFDIIISQSENKYLQKLILYNKIIKTRNLVLKNFKLNNKVDKNQIEPYDKLLIELNLYISKKRKIYINEFNNYFTKTYNFIGKDNHEGNIVYNTKIKDSSEINMFNRSLDQDVLSGKTSLGIHKDDFLFYLDNKLIKNFASQGEQKTFLIGLKMTEYKILHKKLKIKPIMMLDDIFDKLDHQRISDLMEYIINKIHGQIFITDALEDRLKIIKNNNFKMKIITVAYGKII